MDCKEFRENLSAFHEGDLNEMNHAAALAHLSGCLNCKNVHARFNNLLQAVDNLEELPPSEGVRFEILHGLAPHAGPCVVPEIMDAEDLLKYLGITREELEQEIENLPAFEFAGRLKFRKAHIDAWIDARRDARDRDIEVYRSNQWRMRVG